MVNPQRLKHELTPIEQAKKLKALGVTQDSLFWWSHPNEETQLRWAEQGISEDPLRVTIATHTSWTAYEYTSAFTVAELAILLPRNQASFQADTNLWRIEDTFNYASAIGTGKLGRAYLGTSSVYENITGKTEAEVRAKLLIALIEGGIMTAEMINISMNYYIAANNLQPK